MFLDRAKAAVGRCYPRRQTPWGMRLDFDSILPPAALLAAGPKWAPTARYLASGFFARHYRSPVEDWAGRVPVRKVKREARSRPALVLVGLER